MYEKQDENIDVKLGEAFQAFRLSKKISAEKACQGVCSRRTLWNFENGLSSIKHRYLLGLAQNINVPMDEIELAAHDYPLDENEALYEISFQYYYDKNIEMLKDLLASKKHAAFYVKENYLYALYISDLINDLDPQFSIPQDILQESSGYLMEISAWSYNELNLFSHTLHLLTIPLSVSLTRDILKKKKVFLVDNKKKKCLIKTLVNSIFFCLKNDYLEDVFFFLKTGCSLLPEKKFYDFSNEERALNFMYGFYLLMTGKQKEGRQRMMDAICKFLLSGNKLVATQFHRCYDEAIIKLYKKEHNLE
jgi:Rgg/GadR/MutR family transcriptional activator